MKYHRLTTRLPSGAVQYQNGEYLVTLYPQNFNMYNTEKQGMLLLADFEDKITAGTLAELPLIGYNTQDTKFRVMWIGSNGRGYCSNPYFTRKQAEAKVKELENAKTKK